MIGRLLAKRRMIIVGVVAACALVALLVVTSGDEEVAVVSSDWTGTIQIDAPRTMDAGATLAAQVRANAPDGEPVTVAVFDALDTHVQRHVIVGGEVEIIIDGTNLQHSGVSDLVVAIGLSQASIPLEIVALEPVDPVVPLVGPRTIIANANDFTMVVASPMDRFGNPVANGTEVITRALRPGGDIEVQSDLVTGGVAATIVQSGTEVGRVSITSTAQGATGPANIVDQVAGVPDAFVIEIDERNPIADGFALHQMTTSTLMDTFGNVLPDGVSATFVVDSAAGRSFVEATVQGGTAIGLLEAPSLPGQVTVTARVSGRESDSTTLEFSHAVASVPVLAIAESDQVTISVGRVDATRGGYPPDGTPLEIVDPTSGTVIGSGALREGQFTTTLSLPGDIESLQVHILGFVETFEVSNG